MFQTLVGILGETEAGPILSQLVRDHLVRFQMNSNLTSHPPKFQGEQMSGSATYLSMSRTTCRAGGRSIDRNSK